MAKKYLKDKEGIVRATTTNTLGLEKPLLNENYDINVHNRNMDKIENAFNNVATDAAGTSYDNSNSHLKATNVQNAIDELALEVNSARVSLIDSCNKIVDLLP